MRSQLSCIFVYNPANIYLSLLMSQLIALRLYTKRDRDLRIPPMFGVKGPARSHYMRMHYRLGPVTVAGLDSFHNFHVVMGTAVQVTAIVVTKRL